MRRRLNNKSPNHNFYYQLNDREMSCSGMGLYFTQAQTSMNVPIRPFTYQTTEPRYVQPYAPTMNPNAGNVHSPLHGQANRFDYPTAIKYPPTGLYNAGARDLSMFEYFPNN